MTSKDRSLWRPLEQVRADDTDPWPDNWALQWTRFENAFKDRRSMLAELDRMTIERNEALAEAASWRDSCTGKHGSQQPCVTGSAPETPAGPSVAAYLRERAAEVIKGDVVGFTANALRNLADAIDREKQSEKAEGTPWQVGDTWHCRCGTANTAERCSNCKRTIDQG